MQVAPSRGRGSKPEHLAERIPDLLATPAAVRFVSAEPLIGAIDFERVGNMQSIGAAMPLTVEREERGRPKRGDGSISGMQIDAIGSPGSSITFFQTPDHMGGITATSPRAWPRLDWIVLGGESGPGARPMHPDWARAIRDQCAAAGVPLFFKQWGSFLIGEHNEEVSSCIRWQDGTEEFYGDHQDIKYGGHWLEYDKAGRLTIAYPASKARAGRLLDGVEHNGMPVARA